ncbi:MAG: hypothetical protein BAA02_04410 [Paenibacillaceae bacterium ZCTH02-B3]|nr:MAG: hypothetical protein BAA02_04410 [Paenibacillaceae bacterium ZCTH02-B3]
MDASASLMFILSAFALAAVLIMRRDSIPPKLRRGMAIFTLVLVTLAFILLVYSLWTAGAETAGTPSR